MHFEILIEDQSGKTALDILIPKILESNEHTFRVISYKGIGSIPKNLNANADPKHRILLQRLPKMLQGIGKTFAGYGPDYRAAVIVICDLDDKCQHDFRNELLVLLDNCNPKPETAFCFAIEEGEAWLLGGIAAIQSAYNQASSAHLQSYQNDTICGTWEYLADAIYPGGSDALSKKGWQTVGTIKSEWAEKIPQHMDIENNDSPSFCYFRDKIRGLI